MLGTRMTHLESYKAFLAIKQHFKNKKYDLFAQGVKIRGTQAQLDERYDKHYYLVLSDKYLKGDLLNFYMSNILAGRDHPSNMEDVVFREWQAKQHTLLYRFEQDLKKLQGLGYGVRPLFETSTGAMPVALQALNGGHIELDTICVIDILTQGAIMQQFDNQITDTFIYPDIRNRIVKYKGFMRFNKESFNAVLMEYLK